MEHEHMRQTLEHYRKLREKALAAIKPQLDEIRGFDAIILRLASDLKEPVNIEPVVSESASSATSFAGPTPGATNGGGYFRPLLKTDECFLMSQSEAAEGYLEMISR